MTDSIVPILRYVSGKMVEEAENVILLDYIPPFPREDTKPEKVVVWNRVLDVFLRFDVNPIWDVYGTDYETVERALAAIAQAPAPQKPYVAIAFPARTPRKSGRSRIGD